jgi:hypothetical protein
MKSCFIERLHDRCMTGDSDDGRRSRRQVGAPAGRRGGDLDSLATVVRRDAFVPAVEFDRSQFINFASV